MSEHFHAKYPLGRGRDAALKREVAGIDSYYELDEIQLVRRYDEFHTLEQQPLLDDQRQLVDFVIKALLTRIEYKISPSFRHQLEEEAQQTNHQQEHING
ncbi:hypothetical protein [Pseudarthrobacter sp. H2]|uniref:hypothetical protein n=1 Tax=Pseudarthrobacter sp. H2 TaxID=3418415 RepID=UPI003CFB8671